MADLYKSKAWLSNRYKEGMSSDEIAKLCGVTRMTVFSWAKKFGLIK